MFHMILVGLIVAAVVAGMVTFWKEITEWLKTVIKAVKEKNWKAVLYGTKTFLKKVGKKFKRIAEHFSKIKDSDQWKKTTTIHEELVDADDVPEEIRMKAARESEDTVDITHETEKELEMAYRS